MDEEADILEFLRSEQDAYYSGDFEAFIDHWHHGPEVRQVLSGPQVGTRIHRGWEELLPRFEEGFRQYPQDFNNREIIRNQNVQVQISGDMAWISYDQVTRGSIEGMSIPSFAHGIKIVQRFEGKWKLICMSETVPDIKRADVPCIELASNGQIIEMNTLAKRQLRTHPGLLVSGTQLRAKQKKFDQQLQQAIKDRMSALSTNLPPKFVNRASTIVPLGEDNEGHLIFCWVSAEQERVLITFDDEMMLENRMKLAADAFSLSPAQTALAVLLASGCDLKGAASELDVSINTVRTQLRRMFEKTGTHNQTNMVSLLLNANSPN